MNALEVITDAYQRCNRLSPGESLGGDDIERGFTRLNLLVDEWAADSRFLFQDVLTSAAQPVVGLLFPKTTVDDAGVAGTPTRPASA